MLHLLHLPSWLAAAAGVLWMDLPFYYWRRLNHLEPLLALPKWQGFLAPLSPRITCHRHVGVFSMLIYTHPISLSAKLDPDWGMLKI
jgi:hypothetical protein